MSLWTVFGEESDAGIVYAATDSGDLLWYRDLKRDGSPSETWAFGGAPKKVAHGWWPSRIAHVLSGGDGVVYVITSDGGLLWYKDLARDGGASGTWANGGACRQIGSGWRFPCVFSGGDGIIYAVTNEGDLLWYRDLSRDGTSNWAFDGMGKKVAHGWYPSRIAHAFAGGDGVIYVVTNEGDLFWYKDLARDGSPSETWANGGAPRKIGTGWHFPLVFSGGNGVIYAITRDGDLLWYRDQARDGTVNWAFDGAGQKVAHGWTTITDFTYSFLYSYPKGREPGWSEECQGVTHSDTHWFVTQKPRLWKFPVSHDMNSHLSKNPSAFGILQAGIPAHLKRHYNHFGDPDYYGGYVFVPLEPVRREVSVGLPIAHAARSRPCKIVLFSAVDLSYLADADLPACSQDHASWCAVNPSNGLLYSSNSDEVSELRIYNWLFRDGRFALGMYGYGRYQLRDEHGTLICINGIQGGAFSPKTGLLYLVEDGGGPNGGINVFDMQREHRVALIKVDYDREAWGYRNEELEGITVWDLDSGIAPGIRGQIHMAMIDNDASLDNVFLIHYGVPVEKSC
jgi:hypothetical protein